MISAVKTVLIRELPSKRTFKNFGHKRQPTPMFTMLWHGFLTFTFIGLCIEWKKIATYIFGDHGVEENPWDLSIQKQRDQVEKEKPS